MHRFRVDFFPHRFVRKNLDIFSPPCSSFGWENFDLMPTLVQVISLPRAWCIFPSLSKTTFSCQVITKRRPHNCDIQTVQHKDISTSKFFCLNRNKDQSCKLASNQICYWVSPMLYLLVFELRIGSGQKTFPSSIFCDSPSMDPLPRALSFVTTKDSSTILSHKLKPQSLTWARERPWLLDQGYVRQIRFIHKPFCQAVATLYCAYCSQTQKCTRLNVRQKFKHDQVCREHLLLRHLDYWFLKDSLVISVYNQIWNSFIWSRCKCFNDV